MAYMGAIALVLDLLAVRAVAGAALDTRWFTIVRLCSFSLVPIVLGWRLAIIVLVLYEGKTHDDSHLPDSHVDNVDQ